MKVVKNNREIYPTINFRVSLKEKEEIKRRADSLGYNQSEYVRYCIDKEMKK